MLRALLCDVAALHSLRQMNHYIVFSIIWLAKYIVDIFLEQRVNRTIVVTEQNFLSTRSYKSSHCLIFCTWSRFQWDLKPLKLFKSSSEVKSVLFKPLTFCTGSRFQWILVFLGSLLHGVLWYATRTGWLCHLSIVLAYMIM
jgi:hypothetical protein